MTQTCIFARTDIAFCMQSNPIQTNWICNVQNCNNCVYSFWLNSRSLEANDWKNELTIHTHQAHTQHSTINSSHTYIIGKISKKYWHTGDCFCCAQRDIDRLKFQTTTTATDKIIFESSLKLATLYENVIESIVWIKVHGVFFSLSLCDRMLHRICLFGMFYRTGMNCGNSTSSGKCRVEHANKQQQCQQQ